MSIKPLLALPANAKIHELEFPDVTLAVLEVLPEGQPIATVQLVHGFTGSKEDFWELAQLLAAAGFRVLAHDHRGHNQSGHVSVDLYNIANFADDILKIQDHFGVGSSHLVGHSLGGMISRLAVIHNPDRFLTYTLLGTGPDASRDTTRYRNFANFVADRSMAEVWDSLSIHPDPAIAFGPSESWPAHTKQRWLSTDPQAHIATVNIIETEPDRTDELAATGVKFHSMFGEHDDVWTPEQQSAVARRLGATITSIPGCGHCPNEEDPVTTSRELVKFWNSLHD
ncbi:MAG: hypothetical protein RIS75_643 [Actinomycetota bacterium]